MKGALGAGVAATGLTAFSGSAAAQPNVRRLNIGDVDIEQIGGGLVNLQIQVRNINVLRDFDDLTVTVIGGDVFGDEVNILRDVDVDVIFEDRVINVENVDINILNDSIVQVAIAALGTAGNAAAQGSTVLFDTEDQVNN